MPETKPNEEALKAFKKEEEEREKAAALKKEGKLSKEQKARLKLNAQIETSKEMTKKELLGLAAECGFAVDTSGEHATIIAPDGKKLGVPGHGLGKTLSKGMKNSLLKFIGVKK